MYMGLRRRATIGDVSKNVGRPLKGRSLSMGHLLSHHETNGPLVKRKASGASEPPKCVSVFILEMYNHLIKKKPKTESIKTVLTYHLNIHLSAVTLGDPASFAESIRFIDGIGFFR